MFVYYFSGYYIFDFMVHLPVVNTVANGLASVGNGVGHALNATINKGRRNPKSFKKPFPENDVGWTVSNFTKQPSYGGKSKKLRKPRRKSRKTRRKSNNKRSTKRSRK